MNIYDQYETVIGLEVHVQLSTASKAFCGDSTRFGADPNTQVSAISLGHPGTLPRLNKQQVESAVKLGLALNCEINPRSTFDRKNYFYADLPKGYQITQDQAPICIGGHLEVKVGEEIKKIRLHHIHMEEDAGKSIHDQAPRHSLIDLNRAGVPLLEIVTEPDFRSAEEVEQFMLAMRQLVRYLEVSDGNMQEGSMRCDCNVSVRLKGSTAYGERCEIKNMNSMRFAKKAINYERRRQIDLIEKGENVQQQTLNFDPQTGITSPLRSKEDAHDYRYFPDPDLPPVILTQEKIEQVRNEMPALPHELKEKFETEYQLSDYDATILIAEKTNALHYIELAKSTNQFKALANLYINKIIPYLQENNLSAVDFPCSAKNIAALINLIQGNKISNNVAYSRLFPNVIENPDQHPEELAKSLDLLQSDDLGALETIVAEVLTAFPDKVTAYKKGKKGLQGFFMGEVMRRSKGKANPKATQQLLAKHLK